MSRILTVVGTSTDVGKTIVTAAVAALARHAGARVAVCKPAQTGMAPDEPGDLAVVEQLSGVHSTLECARYPEPLAPETAAIRAGLPQLDRAELADAVLDLAVGHDLTLIEGAGGVLVRLATDLTIVDVAQDVAAEAVVVVPAGLGALNHAELTVTALRSAGVRPAGLVIGSWPADPDLAMRCNRIDLPRLTGVDVVGAIPAGAGTLPPERFRAAAPTWFEPGFASSVPTSASSVPTFQPIEGVHP
ncbi:dethiobiotin synthase [Gordonia sp. NPDC003429]